MEIEGLLTKAGCTQFTIGSDVETRRAMVQFKANNRIVRMVIALPNPSDQQFTQHPRYKWQKRPAGQVQKAVEQAERQRWRALFLVIKAKLEAVESQIATFEEEFLPHIVLPDDTTVGSVVLPLVQAAYSGGRGLLQANNP